MRLVGFGHARQGTVFRDAERDCGRSEESLDIEPNSTLASLFDAYSRRFETLRDKRPSILFARNREFATPETALAENDEVAFLPPVSGGSGSPICTSEGHVYAITRDPIDSQGLSRRLKRPEDGAVVVFEGVVRNNTKGRPTSYLEYECYEPMALEQLARIGNETAAKFSLGRIGIVHRLGRLHIGEASVAVIAVAPHRRPAFEAALEGIDRLSEEGAHSVGVARQYCGQLGKQDNCQVAVSLSIANHHASLPVAYRLYLPEDWAEDSQRRRKTGVPEDVGFKTKPEIALEQIEAACKAGLPRGVVLMDAGYGCNTDLRAGISALALCYVAGIMPQTTVWASGTGPLPPKKWSGRGRPPKLIRRDDKHQPVSVKELALGLPKRAWRTIKWREGTADALSSRFARVRVRVAHRDYKLTDSRPEEWLLIEWPKGEDEPTKYWLSTLPQDITFRALVDITKLRWRIERDYQELKQEVGLGHFEGRGWRGFHHHATLCIAAYGFLISERETIPPSGPRSTTLFPKPAVPNQHLDDADWKNAAVLIAALPLPGWQHPAGRGRLPTTVLRADAR